MSQPEPPDIRSEGVSEALPVSVRRPEDEGIIWVEAKATPEARPALEKITTSMSERIWSHAVAHSRDRGVATTDEGDVRYGYNRFLQSEIENRTRKPRIWHALITVGGTVGGVILGRSFAIPPPNQLYWFAAGVVLIGLLVVRELLHSMTTSQP